MTWPPFTAIYCSNVRKSKTVLDSGLQVLDSSTGNLYSGFLEPYSGFQSPGFLIFKQNFPWFPDTTSKNFPDSFKRGYLISIFWENNPPKKCSTLGFVDMDYCNIAKLHHRPFQKPYRYDTDKNCAFLTTGMTDWYLI